jgi:hypothetical protein
MKKSFLISAMYVLVFIITSSCSKESKNCNDLISKANAAGLALTANQTTANCQAARNALNDLLACSYLSAAERSNYQATLNALPPC